MFLVADAMSSQVTAKLASTIYAPYKPYIRQYKSFEETTLTDALNNIRLDAEDVLDTVNLLAESVAKLFAAASQVRAPPSCNEILGVLELDGNDHLFKLSYRFGRQLFLKWL